MRLPRTDDIWVTIRTAYARFLQHFENFAVALPIDDCIELTNGLVECGTNGA